MPLNPSDAFMSFPAFNPVIIRRNHFQFRTNSFVPFNSAIRQVETGEQGTNGHSCPLWRGQPGRCMSPMPGVWRTALGSAFMPPESLSCHMAGIIPRAITTLDKWIRLCGARALRCSPSSFGRKEKQVTDKSAPCLPSAASPRRTTQRHTHVI